MYSEKENLSGMLSDNDIRFFWEKGIRIFTSESGEFAFNLDQQLQLGSIDLRFRHDCKRIKLESDDILTYEMLRHHSYTEPFEITDSGKVIINPGEMILTTTLETIQLSEAFAGIITGRSSIARLGIMVHCCQEFVNPGHGQPIPLQIINIGKSKVELDLRIPICQLVLFKLRTKATDKYSLKAGSKYYNEEGPEDSKIYTEIKYPSITPTPPKRFINKLKLKKWLVPFLPSIIITLLFIPILEKIFSGEVINDVLLELKDLPILSIIGLFLLIIYILLMKGDKK